MSQKPNWKSACVLYGSFALAAIAFTLTPDNWAFLAAAAIVLTGWFISDAINAAAQTSDAAARPDLPSEVLSVVSGSMFFGLLTALILPGIGVAFRLGPKPIYAAGFVIAVLFGLGVYRKRPRWRSLLAAASFAAPVLWIAFRWYNG